MKNNVPVTLYYRPAEHDELLKLANGTPLATFCRATLDAALAARKGGGK